MMLLNTDTSIEAWATTTHKTCGKYTQKNGMGDNYTQDMWQIYTKKTAWATTTHNTCAIQGIGDNYTQDMWQIHTKQKNNLHGYV